MLGAQSPQRFAIFEEQNLIFDFGDLKLRDLAKLLFFKLITMKSNF